MDNLIPGVKINNMEELSKFNKNDIMQIYRNLKIGSLTSTWNKKRKSEILKLFKPVFEQQIEVFSLPKPNKLAIPRYEEGTYMIAHFGSGFCSQTMYYFGIVKKQSPTGILTIQLFKTKEIKSVSNLHNKIDTIQPINELSSSIRLAKPYFYEGWYFKTGKENDYWSYTWNLWDGDFEKTYEIECDFLK